MSDKQSRLEPLSFRALPSLEGTQLKEFFGAEYEISRTKIENLIDANSHQQFIKSASELIGDAYCSEFSIGRRDALTGESKTLTNASEEWLEVYSGFDYMRTDPRIAHCLKCNIPYPWDTALLRRKVKGRMVDAFDAHEHRAGIVIPIRDIFGDLTVVFLTTSAHIKADIYRSELYGKAIKVASYLHAVTSFSFDHDLQSVELTVRQKECLELAATGKTHKAIALILNLSVPTVREHLDNARRSLNAVNLKHALSIAKDAKIIKPGQ